MIYTSRFAAVAILAAVPIITAWLAFGNGMNSDLLLLTGFCTFVATAIAQAREIRSIQVVLENAQSDLSESRARLAMAEDAAGLGCWELDLSTGRIAASSRQFELFQIPEAPFITIEQMFERLAPGDRKRTLRDVKRALLSKASEFQTEYRLVLGSGETRWIMLKGRVQRNSSGEASRLTGTNVDVTELKTAQLAAIHNQERFCAAFTSAAIAMTIIDLHGRYLECNEACSRITGYSPEELLQRDFTILLHPDDVVPVQGRLQSLLVGEVEACTFETPIIRKDRTSRRIRVSVSVLRKGGQPVGFIGLSEDIEDQKRAEERLDYQRTHDVVSGARNRRWFAETLRASLQKGEAGSVIYLDLALAHHGASLGHAAVDELVRQAAHRLNLLAPGTEVARFGSHQFTLLLVGDVTGATARKLLEEFYDSLSDPFTYCGRDLTITCNAGISLFPQDGTDECAVIQHADAAMLSARVAGANACRLYVPQIGEEQRDRAELESELRGAATRGEVEVVYQPEFDLRSGKLVRFEALSRWHHPKFGPVSPARFIPVAEDSGHIVHLGEWVLRTACRRAANWNAELAYPPVGVAVNVSTVQFLKDDFVDLVLSIVKDTELDPSLLQLELTESVVMPGFSAASARMTELRAAGISLAVDDFGTGYSSLSYLRRLPFDGLKIDRSFVRDLDSDPTALAMVQSLLSLAHNFSMRVVVEGVETETQLRSLQQIGCDEVQGFLLGRPDSAPERYFMNQQYPHPLPTAADRCGLHCNP